MNASFQRPVDGPTRDPRIAARELHLTRASMAATALAALAPLWFLFGGEASGVEAWPRMLSATVLLVVAWGVLTYHGLRIAWLMRLRESEAVPASPAWPGPALAILVPAYREEAPVVFRTLVSAALQDVPRRRVVLLLDDPPHGGDRDARLSLLACRRLPGEVTATLRGIGSRCESAMSASMRLREAGRADARDEAARLASLHREVAANLEELARRHDRGDHEDAFFAEHVLRERARRMLAKAEDWGGPRGLRADAGERKAAFQDLVDLFDVEVTVFERKRYANLPHEPNKAMNLNAWLSLLGGAFREERHDAGFVLVAETDAARADLVVPDADHVLMVDADTVLLPDYASRMVAILEAPGAERVAVVQAPYRAFPGARSPLERIAGATTDVQFLLHQGMSGLRAAFWVGANAVARVTALRELAVTTSERGWPVRRYLHDRTVIEDTETTLELVRRGWSLHSHPEPLAFSATPRDFGSLVVQRLRWANGGVLLLPALLRSLRGDGRGATGAGVVEGAVRLHYLVSLGPTGLALLALPFLCFADGAAALFTPAMAAGYFVLYARDLLATGYGAVDALRVYALNLLLVPVNVLGFAMSLGQAMTGRKARFVRTPKVETRTPVPGPLLVAEVATLTFWALFAVHLAGEGSFVRAALVGVHVVLLAWAITRFVGWREAASDFLADVRGHSERVDAPDLESIARVEES